MEKLQESLTRLQCELVAERNLVNPDNISWLQYDILSALKHNKAILPSALSLLLGVSRTKLSKALRELKMLGYVTQIPNDKDGRELLTSISLDGEKLLIGIANGHNNLLHTAQKVFSVEEQQLFLIFAEKLSNALKEERSGNYE